MTSRGRDGGEGGDDSLCGRARPAPAHRPSPGRRQTEGGSSGSPFSTAVHCPRASRPARSGLTERERERQSARATPRLTHRSTGALRPRLGAGGGRASRQAAPGRSGRRKGRLWPGATLFWSPPRSRHDPKKSGNDPPSLGEGVSIVPAMTRPAAVGPGGLGNRGRKGGIKIFSFEKNTDLLGREEMGVFFRQKRRVGGLTNLHRVPFFPVFDTVSGQPLPTRRPRPPPHPVL